MTNNDETLRRAHEDGTWEAAWHLLCVSERSRREQHARDLARATDELILERAKRRDALGVGAAETDWHGIACKKEDELTELRARNAEIEASRNSWADDAVERADRIIELEAWAEGVRRLLEVDDDADVIEKIANLLSDWRAGRLLLLGKDAELTALRNRKPNYESAERVMRTTFESGWRPWYGDVARKIADAAFEPRE
jgi:hypothetical protein